MNSILNISISCFANYQSTTPKPVNLLSWLQSDKYAKKVDLIRKEPDKERRNELKAKLPAITPSGTFTERSLKGLVKHSGFIQFDIDNVPDIQAVKRKICTLSNVAYCGLSVSGLGLWGLIPIAEPEHHTDYFTFIQKVFAGMGITIDAACKDVCRLRGYSYDPNAYFNHAATPLQKWFNPIPKQPYNCNYSPITGGGNMGKVEYCLNEIQAKGIDLTPTYEAWFKIGCSLAGEFGEAGRDYFHSVSQFHPKYNFQDTNKQFNHCLRHRYSTSIATFFATCKDAGIMFKEKTFIPDVPAKPTGVQPIYTLADLVKQGNEDAVFYDSGVIDKQEWYQRINVLQEEILKAGFSLKQYVKAANS